MGFKSLPYPRQWCQDVYYAFLERYTRATKIVLHYYPELNQNMIVEWIGWNDGQWNKFKRAVKAVESAIVTADSAFNYTSDYPSLNFTAIIMREMAPPFHRALDRPDFPKNN